MEPLLVLGAALVGGIVARVIAPSSDSKQTEPKEVPQSYVLTPVSGGTPSTEKRESVNPVEAVGKFTV